MMRYCYCQRNKRHGDMIQCGFCLNWFHQICVGFTGKDVPSISDNWECRWCANTVRSCSNIINLDDTGNQNDDPSTVGEKHDEDKDVNSFKSPLIDVTAGKLLRPHCSYCDPAISAVSYYYYQDFFIKFKRIPIPIKKCDVICKIQPACLTLDDLSLSFAALRIALVIFISN
jgi:hypothetical protein